MDQAAISVDDRAGVTVARLGLDEIREELRPSAKAIIDTFRFRFQMKTNTELLVASFLELLSGEPVQVDKKPWDGQQELEKFLCNCEGVLMETDMSEIERTAMFAKILQVRQALAE